MLSASSENQKPKTSTILQLIAQTSKRNSSLSSQIQNVKSFQIFDGSAIASFISNLAPQERLQLLLEGLLLPFDNLTNTLITRFVSSALGKNLQNSNRDPT